MRKKASFLALLFISISLCHLSAGCRTGSTAAEIAESYGVLNGWNLQPKVAEIIQSGRADEMITNGSARVRNRVSGYGSSRILVTEHLISGKVYRIEVRRAIDPTQNIPWNKTRYATSQHGSDKKVIEWLHLASVWKALRNNSYEAQPKVAYRAWRGVDKQVHGVETSKSPALDWESSEDDTHLCIRTSYWPVTTLWFRGLSLDGRQKDNRHSRWIGESAGPDIMQQETNAENRIHFVNLKLYKAIGS